MYDKTTAGESMMLGGWYIVFHFWVDGTLQGFRKPYCYESFDISSILFKVYKKASLPVII